MKTLFISFLLLSTLLRGQNSVLCRNDPSNNHIINIKWYFKNIVSSEGFNIYRKESNSRSWIKLNMDAITFKSYAFTENDYKIDKELKEYVKIASSKENLNDLPLLASVIKSFTSKPFCKYLGIYFDDITASSGNYYEYKVCLLKNKKECDSALSKPIKLDIYVPTKAPNEITVTKGKNQILFKWLPEPHNYYGVNIYKQIKDTGSFFKITNSPVLVSKTSDQNGNEVYGNEFFIDKEVHPHIKYNYYLEAVDYFGSPSIASERFSLILKDHSLPKAPDSIYQTLNGRKVHLEWHKKIKEEDLFGYNVYRTTKNDTDFKKLNKSPLTQDLNHFNDSVPEFGSYFYIVSSVDLDSNEAISNPHLIEVYDNEAPRQPKNLVLKADTGKLILNWDMNTEKDLKGYLIYRTIDINKVDSYTKITPSAIMTDNYIDILPKSSKNKFFYKIVAIDESYNKSPYSEWAHARMPDVIPPNSPFLTKASVTKNNEIIIEWFSNSEPDLAGYHLFRRNVNDSTDSFKKVNQKQINRHQYKYVDRNYEDGFCYEYYLIAIDSCANVSIPSNCLKLKLKLKRQEITSSITRFEAKYHSKKQQIELKWKYIPNDNLNKAMLYKRNNNESLLSPYCFVNLDENFIDKKIQSNNYYTYQLRIYTLNGDVIKSQFVTLQVK